MPFTESYKLLEQAPLDNLTSTLFKHTEAFGRIYQAKGQLAWSESDRTSTQIHQEPSGSEVSHKSKESSPDWRFNTLNVKNHTVWSQSPTM